MRSWKQTGERASGPGSRSGRRRTWQKGRNREQEREKAEHQGQGTGMGVKQHGNRSGVRQDGERKPSGQREQAKTGNQGKTGETLAETRPKCTQQRSRELHGAEFHELSRCIATADGRSITSSRWAWAAAKCAQKPKMGGRSIRKCKVAEIALSRADSSSKARKSQPRH